MTPEQEIAWLAGFYEGEGCTNAYTYPANDGLPRRKIMFILVQLNYEPIEQAKEILINLGITPHRIKIFQQTNGSRAHRLRIETFKEVEKICIELFPYLSTKRREQILAAFQIYCLNTIGQDLDSILLLY